MRRVRCMIACSLDGYIARPDGGVDWLFTDGDFGMKEFFSQIDTVLLGRKSYEKMMEMTGGSGSYPGLKGYVFSRTLPPGEREGTEFVDTDLAEFVRRLLSKPGKDIWLCGGGEIVHALLKEGLVDTLEMALHPVILGEGIELFPGERPEIALELTRYEQHENGLVQVWYDVKR